LIELRLSTVDKVRFVPLLPVYEPLPDSTTLEADLRLMARTILSKNRIDATDSEKEPCDLVLEVHYDQDQRDCACTALLVSASLVEPATLGRRWNGDRGSLAASYSSVTSWQTTRVVLVRTEDLADGLREAAELALTEFAEAVAEAQPVVQQ